MPEKKKRCALYIRVSTAEQHLNGLSLPAQEKALKEFAITNGYTIIGIYADEGISARKSMKNRKQLLRLLEDVTQNKIDMILVTKLDRWFRNIKDYNITEEILQAHHCHWKTIFENYDSSTANGQMVINIMLSVNQAECDRTSERIKAVFDYKVSKGEVISGRHAPYGYTVKNNHIIKDSSVQEIVEDAYRYYFTCFSRRKVISYLQTKYGDRAPSVYKIDRLFTSEKYAGSHNGNNKFCEPYITMEQFDQIQTITQSRLRPESEYTYIFSSLLVCPTCGKKMSGKLKKQKLRTGGVSLYPRYVCQDKYNRHSSPCISETVVEQYMIDHVFENLKHEETKLASKKLSCSTSSGNADRIRSELDRLNTMFQKGRITEEFYDNEYERLQNELKKLTADNTICLSERLSKISDMFTGNWLELYEKLDNEHKRTFWKSAIKEITFDPDTHKISGFKFLL